MDDPEDGLKPIDHLFAKKINPNGTESAAHFLAHLLKTAREGHLCMDLSSQSYHSLREASSILPDSLFTDYLVRENSRIYLRRNWECEKIFLKHLERVKFQSPALNLSQKKINERLELSGLNGEQNAAILKAASRSLTVISGGPGTGKTYTAAKLIDIFYHEGVKKIAVAAPTGKATANLRAALARMELEERCEIQTLHSLLKRERIQADLILVDEGSMVDAELMSQLFKGVKQGGRLILFGDKHQLPPVESGNFFADLAQIPEIVADLKTCLRTDLKEITEMAAQVKEGRVIAAQPLPSVKELIRIILDEKKHLLTPLRRGIYGADHLNTLLYNEHRKRGAQEVPIMITVNDPYLELFNGDTGILNIMERRAYFSDGRTFIDRLLPPYEFAYALSVHKSQGSEYDHVMIILPQGSESFGREMLYTAITRAKKSVSLYANEGVIQRIVSTNTARYSALSGIREKADA